MGTFKFSWAHPAEEVYVTGTFDNWTKSEQLSKVGDVFEKVVTLPDASKKIYYKFVVDNNWVTDHTAQQEPDHEGNVNNFLTPEQIVKEDSSTAVMNTVTPESTTAALAKDVPFEDKHEPKATPSDVPGSFPLTPANELEKQFGVNPLPASEGGVNPITLAPGEPIPPSTKSGDINAQVKQDKESYEKGDTLPGIDSELPPVTSNMIPESSLPIISGKDAFVSNVTPQSTTAALAGEVPLEPKVPEIVKESQEKAHVEAEASADPEELREKAAVEDELLKKVPEAPSTSEGTSGFGTQKTEKAGTFAATAATAGGAAFAAAVAAKDLIMGKSAPVVDQATVAATDAAAKLPDSVKDKLPVSVQQAITTQTKEETREEVSPEVPAEVKASIQESGKSPEAAANTEAVEEKKAVEAELLKEVKEVPAETETKKEEPKKEEPVTAVTLKEEPAKEANGTDTTAPKEPVAPATPVKASAPKPETTTPGSSKAAESPANTLEKKKKNRLSSMFSKIKHKVASKETK